MDRREVRALMVRLNRDAERIATRFDLRYRSIQAERAGVNGHYGICYSDGVIKIRLRHARTDQPLKYSSLVNTLCHELAHLRHFDHGPRFKAFYFRLLDWARAEGIYQPGRASETRPPAVSPAAAPTKRREAKPEGPRQLDLFGP
jgi:hypothetical protein